MHSFSNKLDKAIKQAINEEDMFGQGTTVNQAHKMLTDFSHAADRTSMGLEDLKKIMETSGLADNKSLIPFMEQLEMFYNNLKKDGVLRKNFEAILSTPTVTK